MGMAEDGNAFSYQDESKNKISDAVERVQKDTKSSITTVQQKSIARTSPRSSSPAKRRASVMEYESAGSKNKASNNDNQTSKGDSDTSRPDISSKKASSGLPDRNISLSTSVSPPASAIEDELPSLDDQVKSVMELHVKEYEDKQKLIIISNKWLARVFARTSEGLASGSHEKDALEGPIGPVDNSNIIMPEIPVGYIKTISGDAFVPLKPDLRLGEDFEILPEKAWKLIIQWYGLVEESPIVVRYAHDTSPEGAISRNIQCEVYPPICTVKKLLENSAGTTFQALREKGLTAPCLAVSRNEYVQSFLKALKATAGIGVKTKVRLWRAFGQSQLEQDINGRSGMLTPAASRSGSPNVISPGRSSVPLLLDMPDFVSMAEGTHKELVDIKDETMNDKYNGHLKLDTIGLASDQVLILEEQVKNAAAEEYVSDRARKTAEDNCISITVTPSGTSIPQKGKDQGLGQSGRSSPASIGPVTRGRTRKDGRTRGTVGLVNLGNTCYMNSALQCIRSVEELSLYFLQQEYKNDFNVDNPLGYGGAIAKTYAGLLASIYGENATSSFAPKNFKMTLGRCQPIFSGYGQQDSQEFLSFLVDGLHEDLNRVLKKPYIENPESDDNTVEDPQAIRVLGDKFRENHRARNDSVAMDLFNGFYKNTMVCPKCAKVSITFDPFSLLTLQLPIESLWQHTVYFAPLRGHPVKVEVDMDKSSSIGQLKEYVAKRIPGLQPKKLMCAEVYAHKFFKTFTDELVISTCNIQSRDDIVLYELDDVPSNFPPPKKNKASRARSAFGYNNVSSEDDIPEDDCPLADKMMVPLFHSVIEARHARSRVLKLWPSFILLSREESKDYDSILRKVIAKVATMTTKQILEDVNDDDTCTPKSMRPGQDSDEDISTDLENQPIMKPLEGEDSVVDISMTDVKDEKDEKVPGLNSKTSTAADKSEPSILEPGGFISPKFRTLFEMKYVKSTTKLVPTAWSQFDSNYRDYPSLLARLPQFSSRRSSQQSNSTYHSTSSASEDFDDVPEFSNNNRRNFNTDSDSDDDIVASSSPYRNRNMAGGNYFDSKKARAMHSTQSGKQAEDTGDSEIGDMPMLIRLGEAILLEWEPEGYSSLFEGNYRDNMRGRDTWSVMEQVPDATLQEIRAKRLARRRSGITLEDCFKETSKGEILSEENAWYCNRCKELRRASKTLEIWTVPDILVIHLKRFSSNRALRDKVDVLIDFPTEGLDLSGRVGLQEGKDLVYDLFAVDNHYGGLGGGHYTAFAQNFFDKKWYEYNDSSVGQRSQQAVVTSAAYLLFYRRRSDKPLGPPYLHKIVHEANEEISKSPESSRAQSLAGEGRRLGDFSRNGSSGALAGAEAAHLPRGHGSVGETLAKNENEVGVVNFGNDTEADGSFLPLDDDDEGVGLDMNLKYNKNGSNNNEAIIAPLQTQYNPRRPLIDEWDFSNADRYGEKTMSDDALSDGTGTDVAVPGSTAGDGLQDRIMTDFSNEDVEGRPVRQGRPTGQLSEEEELPDLIGEDGTVRLNTGMEEDIDDPVAEVRVDESDEIKPN